MQSQIKQSQGSALKRSIPSWLWWVSVFSLTFLILFVSLGRWQLDRASEKQVLLGVMEQRRQTMPITAHQLPVSAREIEAAEFQPVQLRGHFDPAFTVMLDNRIRGGRAGVEIFGLFQAEGLPTPVLVNRGWLPFADGRRSLPDRQFIAGELELRAEVYRPSPPPILLAGSGPRQQSGAVLVQHVEPDVLGERLGIEVAPVVLRLVQGSPATLRTEWPGIMVSPQKHTAYAVQWFAMAFALLALTVWCWKKWWSQERE